MKYYSFLRSSLCWGRQLTRKLETIEVLCVWTKTILHVCGSWKKWMKCNRRWRKSERFVTRLRLRHEYYLLCMGADIMLEIILPIKPCEQDRELGKRQIRQSWKTEVTRNHFVEQILPNEMKLKVPELFSTVCISCTSTGIFLKLSMAFSSSHVHFSYFYLANACFHFKIRCAKQEM